MRDGDKFEVFITGKCGYGFLDSTGFEDTIRKAVSLGGDSDTLACITGGIAEAYYKEIPPEIADRVVQRLPAAFKEIFDAMREETAYGHGT